MRRVVETESAPKPIGPYSQAIETETAIFCAGQIGIDPSTGKLVEGGAAAETDRAIANLEAVLAAIGLGLADVVKTTLFLTDLADGSTVSAIYAKRFSAPYPARSTIQVAALPAGARVELEAIAIRR